jgi:DNA-binding transcriptional regulator YhcF (GntR family)
VTGVTQQPEAITSDSLDLALDRRAEVPIGVQLAWALRARIRDGRFEPGQRLPGLRDLAQALGVNANTVRAVYQRLEHEGIIESQQGSGTFVAPTPQKPSTVGAIAASAAREARQTGVDPRDVAAALYVAPEPPAQLADAATDQAAHRRRQLRTQITVLDQALAEIEAEHPDLVSSPADTGRRTGPRLLDTEELEHVRAGLVRRLAAAQTTLDEFRQSETAAEEQDPQKAHAPKRAARPKPATRPAPAGT